jgi:hypothetical protein
MKIFMTHPESGFNRLDSCLADELCQAMEAVAAFYVAGGEGNPDALQSSFEDLTKDIDVGFHTLARDRSSDKAIMRISSCMDIVHAAVDSGIARDFPQWRMSRNGLNLIHFLYALQASDLGIVSEP